MTNGSKSTMKVDEFIQSISGVSRSSFSFDGDRVKALKAAYALVGRLETSWDTVARLVLTEVFISYVIMKGSRITDAIGSRRWAPHSRFPGT